MFQKGNNLGFKKGSIPWNKGISIRTNTGRTTFKKGIHYSPKTEFKKGQPPTMGMLGKRRTEEQNKKQGERMKGEKHPMWKGGKSFTWDSRILIYSPEHPFVTKRGYVRRYRLVAEKCLGRYLTRQEVVHHINGVIDDDRPENLFVFPSFASHRKFHYLKNAPLLISNLI